MVNKNLRINPSKNFKQFMWLAPNKSTWVCEIDTIEKARTITQVHQKRNTYRHCFKRRLSSAEWKRGDVKIHIVIEKRTCH